MMPFNLGEGDTRLSRDGVQDVGVLTTVGIPFGEDCRVAKLIDVPEGDAALGRSVRRVGAFPRALGSQHHLGIGRRPRIPVVGELDGRVQQRLRGIAQTRPQHVSHVVAITRTHDHSTVAHLRDEQRRATLETGQPVGAAVQHAGHRQRVNEATVPKGTHGRAGGRAGGR